MITNVEKFSYTHIDDAHGDLSGIKYVYRLSNSSGKYIGFVEMYANPICLYTHVELAGGTITGDGIKAYTEDIPSIWKYMKDHYEYSESYICSTNKKLLKVGASRNGGKVRLVGYCEGLPIYKFNFKEWAK